jgi:hypothetical protein
MPQPTPSQVHIDVALTNISVAYLQTSDDYVSTKVFRQIPVPKQSDKYFIYNRGDFYRDVATLRGPGAPSSGGGYGLTTGSYFADVYAHHMDVDPRVRENSDSPLSADRDATIWVTQILQIRREVQWLSKFFTTGIWTGSTSGNDITSADFASTKNWDISGSGPITDVEAQQFEIKQKTGKWPNVFVLGTSVYRALKNHADITDRYKYTQAAIITPELIARVLSPPGTPEEGTPNFEVIVASAIYNTAAEGATDSLSFIATQQDALLAYSNPNPGILQPSAGYTFVWTPIAGYEARIRQFPMPELGIGNDGTPTMRVEGEITMDAHQVAADMGVYFDGVVT